MKLALVTGGSRGIGREIARQLCHQQVAAVLTARQEAAAMRAAAELRAEHPGAEVEGRPLELGKPESITALAEWIAVVRGGLDIFIANAGISLDGFDAGVARQTIAINFAAQLALTEALLPHLRAEARIVMLSSGLAERRGMAHALAQALVEPALTRARLSALMQQFVDDVAAGRHRTAGWPSSAYNVSKAGLNALVMVLARELAGDARRILVNAVCPGWVRTDMGGPGAPRSVEEGADTPVWAALLGADGPSGGFFRDREPASW